MQGEPILIRNAAEVLTGAGATACPTDILVEAGRIAAIDTSIAAPPAARIIHAHDRLVTPGLVNAHWHSPMQLSHGTSDRMNHKVFMWENQVDTANRSKEEIYLSAVVGCLQMLKSGTTSVIDHFPEQGFGIDDIETVVKAFEDCGMRAVVALRIFDGEYSDIVPPPDRITPELRAALATGNTLKPRPMQESLDLVRAAIGKLDRTAGRIRIFPAPSNPVRCSDALLAACEQMAQGLDTGVHCHLLETRTQAELAQRAYGRTMVEHMETIGAFSGRWSCAHCNWVSPAEIAIMGQVGAVAVFNPESNLKIGSGIPPIPALLAAGVPCAVGTDGASTNDNLILQDALQLVAILHRAGEPDRRRWVTVDDAIAMGTTGGAKAMLEKELGTLTVGAKADLVLYDLSAPWWVPLNDPAQQWVFGERGGSVDTVIVDGKVVVENGKVLTIDEKAVLSAARSILPAVRSRNTGVSAIAKAVAALE